MIWMIIGIPLGYLMLRYSEKIGDAIGTIDFAERYFGGGGTYTFIKLIAFIIIIFSFVYPLGGCDAMLGKLDVLSGK